MHKCTWGFVLLFAVPLLAKPFVVRKVLQTAPKPGVVRDREVEEVAKVKGWGSFTASPGDTIGSSQYDLQWNATPLRRIVYDPAGNTHVLWMHQVGSGERQMFYNFYDGSWASGTGIGGGTAVQTNSKDGFGTIDYMTDGRAVVSLHRGDPYRSCVCVDLMAGGGGFDCVDLPDPPPGEISAMWPRVAVDGDDNMVVVTRTYKVDGEPDSLPKPRNWSRSTNEGVDWSAWVPFDTGLGLTQNVFASKSSNKFCMTWGRDFLENGSYHGHIVYKESNNAGANWGNLVDINALIPLPPLGRTYTLLELRNSSGNTYGIYDSDDNIHIVTDASIGTEKPGRYYANIACVLWHYSSSTSAMNPIAVHPIAYDAKVSEKVFPYTGHWMAKPVIAEDPSTKYLYVGWIEFPYDIADSNGYGIGEIYCSYSLDGGATWAPKLNLTMTPGNCEIYLSMAPIVDEALRIFYMFDKNNHSNFQHDEVLDPDTALFQYLEAPIVTGNIEVVELIDVPDTLGSSYTPKVSYKNLGTAVVSFQARFELTLFPGTITTQIALDTISAPIIFYYDIINVENLAAGATKTVEFKTWLRDSGFSASVQCYHNAYATLLIDTDFSDNLKGDSSYVGIEEHDSRFAIHDLRLESYPNPVRGNASIKYTVPTTAKLNIKVYDITGKLVTTLVDRSHKPGTYTINWNGMDYRGREVPGGIYFYRLTSDKFKESTTRKIVILR